MKNLYSKHPHLSIIVTCFLMSSVIILLSCSLGSFIYPTIAMQPYYNDPSTFVIMGKEMVAGKIPYLEIFDHKGLYIFYITALWAFLGKFGIFLIMSIFITVSLAFLIFTLKELGYDRRTIMVGTLLFSTIYTFFAQFPGDADLVLMLGMGMLYFYVRGYKNEDCSCYSIAAVFAGVSAGVALNIRPSDAMLGFAFMVFYLVKCIKEKKWLAALRESALCIMALSLTALPAYLHAYSGHFLNEMFDAVFISNFRYLGTNSDKSVLLVWLSRFIIVATFGLIILLWFFKRKEYKTEESLFIIIISSILFVIQFAIALFAHYLISVSGFIAIAAVIVINKYKLLEEGKKTRKPITMGMVALFGISLIFNPALYLSHIAYDIGDISYVKETISKEDRKEHTFLFSVYPGLYLNTDINVIYPDFNAQTYHMKLSKNFTEEHMSKFVQSSAVKYFVVKKTDVEKATPLFGNANYVEIEKQTKYPTTIVIYKHVI